MTWYYNLLELQYPIYQFQWRDVIILLFVAMAAVTYGSLAYNFIHSTYTEDKSLTLNWNGLFNLRNPCNFYTFKQYLKKYQPSKLQNCLRQKRPNSKLKLLKHNFSTCTWYIVLRFWKIANFAIIFQYSDFYFYIMNIILNACLS